MQSNFQATISEVSFEEEVWFVLRNIEKARRYEGEVIEYKMFGTPYGTPQGTPLPLDERRVLKMLERQGAIKTVNSKGEVDIVTTSLSQGMNTVIVMVYLKILEPMFGQVYKKYQRLAGLARRATNNQAVVPRKPLTWDTSHHELRWDDQSKELTLATDWSLILFLDVLWRRRDRKLNSAELAREYNAYCEEQMEMQETEGKKPDKRFRKKYDQESVSRTTSYAIKKLHRLFSVDDEKSFPIRNTGSDKNVIVKWSKNKSLVRTHKK